jgi:peptidoglycan/LPS O-acetylase OafA/YrhL
MLDSFSNLNYKLKKMESPEFISLYRNSLMGIAILWIILFHSWFDFGKYGLLSPLYSFFKITGYLGVDIFIFVSGFGLMASWYKKKTNVLLFYKRRFLRIMPIYWFFFSIYLIFMTLFGKLVNMGTMIIYYTGFAFFITKNYLHWFISAILLCYLIFPIFANAFQKSKQKTKFVTMIIISCLLLAFFLSTSASFFDNRFSYLLIVVLRLPSFFIGSLIGYIYFENDINFSYLFSIYSHIFLMSFCFVSLALINYFTSPEAMLLYGLWWYPFAIGSFSLTYLLSIFLKIMHTYLGSLIIILDKIGKCSFELYFIHLLIFEFVGSQTILQKFGILFEGNYLLFVAIIASVIISILFNYLFSYIGLNTLKSRFLTKLFEKLTNIYMKI